MLGKNFGFIERDLLNGGVTLTLFFDHIFDMQFNQCHKSLNPSLLFCIKISFKLSEK